MSIEPSIEFNMANQRAAQWTHRLIDKTDGSKGGTVISITIDGRYFFATAAHVIQNSHQYEVVLRDQGIKTIREFTSRHIHSDADVGLLEIDEKHSYLISSWMTPSDFYGDFDINKSKDVVVIGYPGEYIIPIGREQITADAFMKYVCCNSLTYTSYTIPYDQWPQKVSGCEANRVKDIFIDYDSNGKMYYSPPNEIKISREESLKSPDFSGMSGGGIWDLGIKETEIIVPTAKLIGIQSSISANGDGWIRGTNVKYWLELVADNCPDLKIM